MNEVYVYSFVKGLVNSVRRGCSFFVYNGVNNMVYESGFITSSLFRLPNLSFSFPSNRLKHKLRGIWHWEACVKRRALLPMFSKNYC